MDSLPKFQSPMETDTTTIPSELLLNAHAFIGENPNCTTAYDFTRVNEVIVASFWPAMPPLPSLLYVHCPHLDCSAFSELPHILRMVEDLILIRVAIGCRQPNWILMEECDYFIYQVDRPLLTMLPHPGQGTESFRDEEVGLLPRDGGLYTIAALVSTRDPLLFRLRLFKSEDWRWISIDVTLPFQQSPENALFPIEIPRRAYRLFTHRTSTVITLGGKGGTMGWVDLWSGILLCDVLRPADHLELRRVPLPLPTAQLSWNGGHGVELGCPKHYRGIAFIKGKQQKQRFLRFVDLVVSARRLDKDTAQDKLFRFDDWTIATWTNFKLSNSLDDWKIEYRPIHANKFNFNDHIRHQLHKYQLLQDKDPKRNLANLWVYQPTPSMDTANKIIYLMAGPKFHHPKACLLALDIANSKLQGVVEFGSHREWGEGVVCRPGSFAKCNVATLPTSQDEEEAIATIGLSVSGNMEGDAPIEH